MSRKPVVGTPTQAELGDISVLFIEEKLIDATSVMEATQADLVLKKMYHYTEHGWPSSVTDIELNPFFSKHSELSVSDKMLLWQDRVVILIALRQCS